jgi:ankyrin repeat protein
MLEPCLVQLLKDGCDPNVCDVNGETLLIHIIKSNKIKSFQYLLEYGVDLEGKNYLDQTPIGQAIQSGNINFLKILMD